MRKETKPDPLDAALAALGALSPQSPEDRADIEQAIVGIVRIRSRRTINSAHRARRGRPALHDISTFAPSIVGATTTAEAMQTPLPERSPFYGMGLQLAGPKQLQIAGVPQLPREIWAALVAAGFKSAHSDPVSAVRSALKRRMQTHGDVFLVGEGKWARKDFYTEEELAEIKKSIGGMGGRDKAAHSERTRVGMIVAKRRGARIGAPLFMSPDRVADVKRRLIAGERITDIARDLGISRQTLYVRFNRAAIAKLREDAKAIAEGSKAEESGRTRH